MSAPLIIIVAYIRQDLSSRVAPAQSAARRRHPSQCARAANLLRLAHPFPWLDRCVAMKLYYSRNLNPRLCVAAARHLKAPVEYLVGHTFDAKLRDFFYALNPNLLNPILVEDDGSSLWETDAIVCRLARVVGSDFFPEGVELPELVRWLSWAAYHWGNAGSAMYYDRITVPRYDLKHLSPEEMATRLEDFHQCARILDEVLSRRDWLIGGRPTYADFRVGTVLPFAGEAALPIAEYPHICRYGERLDELPAWRDPFEGLGDAPLT